MPGVHHVPVRKKNRVQRRVDIGVPRTERRPRACVHLADLGRQRLEHGSEGRAVNVDRCQ